MVKLRSSKSSLWVQIPLPLNLNCLFFMRAFSNYVFLISKFFTDLWILFNLILSFKWIKILIKFTLKFFKNFRLISKKEILKENLLNKLISFKSHYLFIFQERYLNYYVYYQNNETYTNQTEIFKKSKNKKTLFIFWYENLTRYSFVGFKYFYKLFKHWLLPLFLLSLIVFHGLIIKALPFNKVVFIWISFFMILYWLISGFVFFFKKYQFGKYTSAIQRFWRRSYILFWLLESCLLFVFIYLTFIASQESFYMYDQIQIYKTHLFSWKIFFLKIFPILLLLLLTYFLLLSLKWNFFSKISYWILIITFILTYVMWIEFYQFFHIVNFYGNLNWLYDMDEKLWTLELEPRRTRIVNHYVMLLLILKFWHLLFVYGFWLFYILRSNEKQSAKYPLLSANFQNFIILYIMSWLFMYPWIKIYFKKLLITPYFWFYVNNRSLTMRIFFYDLKLFIFNVINHELLTYSFNRSFMKNIPFFYWIETNYNLFFNNTRKNYIKHSLLTKFYEI